MKRLILALFLITVLVLPGFAAGYPDGAIIPKLTGSMLGWDSITGKWRPVSVNASGVQAVDLTSAETIQIALYSLPANVIATEAKILAANVAQEVGGNLVVPRKFIEISSSTDAEFWVQISDTTAVGTVGLGRRCVGNFYLELSNDFLINVVADTIMTLNIIEGGVQ